MAEPKKEEEVKKSEQKVDGTEKVTVDKATITTNKEVISIEIESGIVKLNHSAKFTVRLFDSKGKLSDVKSVELSGTDYSNWGTDDSYVVSFILTELGLTKKSIK
jgi:hypothetical protein